MKSVGCRLDLRKIVRSQSELSRAKTVLSEGEVAIATSREEKKFVADRIRSGNGGVCVSRVDYTYEYYSAS